MIKNKKTLIKFIIILLIIIISFILYTKISIHINEKNIKQYIKNNNFQQKEYYIYTLDKKENNIETTEKILFENYLFAKYYIETLENETIKINYYYTNNNEIQIEYEHSFIENEEFKMEAIKATYDQNKLINCENKLGNLSCDTLNKYKLEYEEEINKILLDYKLNTKYLKKVKLN